MSFFKYLILALVFILASCQPNQEKKSEEKKAVRTVNVPAFNADSAYHYVRQQVSLGPRVPGTEAHRNTAQFLIAYFKSHGAAVIEQNFEAITFDNQRLKLKNIIASYSPGAAKRILLAAHWDTRPFADKDPIKKDAPFDGANDGASGVGVLMEIARALGSSSHPTVGVDIILFDGEDWGEKEGEDARIALPQGQESWWCLGSQYWARNKHRKNYSAYYGILVDMVGAKNSRFFREEISMQYAPAIVEKVWSAAHAIGYADYFIKQNVTGITDDHVFINSLAKIPTIDIVHYQPGKGFFGDYHHATSDNMEIISKETLKAVGSTVLHVLYHEE